MKENKELNLENVWVYLIHNKEENENKNTKVYIIQTNW